MTVLAAGAKTLELAVPIAGVLAVACIVAIGRQLFRQWRAAPEVRARGWRVALLVAAQPLCATLLYLALFPPATPGEAGTLVVATAGAEANTLRAGEGDDAVALPEAPALTGVTREPDLATALRRRTGTQRLRVVGAGLESRDRDAAAGLPIEFVPVPLPRGLVALDAPRQAAAGGEFRVTGRVHGVRGGFVELLDPGRQRVDRTALPADGRFALTATTRVAGAAAYTLAVRDAQRRLLESVALPIMVDDASAPRVLVLAGAPGPEVKFLRRWARDAGLPLHTQLSAGAGLQLGDAPIALNPANLARFDVAVLDERALSSLGDGPRAALLEAVRGGLGVLVRVTAALSDSDRQRLRALGFTAGRGGDPVEVRLGSRGFDDDTERARLGPGTPDAPRSRDAAVDDAPPLSRRSARIGADDAAPLLRDASGATLGWWRAEGRGRIGVLALTDTYRLTLAGRSDLHASVWSGLMATLARPGSGQPVWIDGESLVGQRVVACGLERRTRVIAPDGSLVPVLLDPTSGTRACGAFWPVQIGWHRLRAGDRSDPLYVGNADAAPGVHANAVRAATERLALASRTQGQRADIGMPTTTQPGRRWPWWLAWLLASAGLWWLERSRLGRPVATLQSA